MCCIFDVHAELMLIGTLQSLCAAVQEVLAGVQTGDAAAPMTMADATRFADNALEHMVRTLLAALTAPAILESTQGALRWDGLQYEKRYRRLLSPSLQRLLTQPGGLPACTITCHPRAAVSWHGILHISYAEKQVVC